MSIDWPQILGNLFAAAAGGLAAGFATWLAVGRQFKLQRRVQSGAVLELIEFLLREQSKLLERTLTSKATQNDIMLADLDRLAANYSLFERNREHLIHVGDRAFRESVVETLTNTQTWAFITRHQVNERLTARRTQNDEALTKADRKKAKETVESLTQLIDQSFPLAISYMRSCTALAERARELATTAR